MEGSVRAAGVLLLALGMLLADYLPNGWMQSGNVPDHRVITATLATGGFVLVPLGAGLLAVSVVLRGLAHHQGTRFIRRQVTIGVALIVAGVCARVWADVVGENVMEFLGPTGQAGIEVTRLALDLLTTLAPAVGVALIAVSPIQLALLKRSDAVDPEDAQTRR